MSEIRYIYGYGATKHLPSGSIAVDGRAGYEYGLCGAPGGYPRDEPERPTCKRCQSKIAKSDLMAALEESLAKAVGADSQVREIIEEQGYDEAVEEFRAGVKDGSAFEGALSSREEIKNRMDQLRNPAP